MVARIVEQLGGQLRVDSEVGKGSRFSILIPFATEAEGSGSGPSEVHTHPVPQSLACSRGGSELENLVLAISSSPNHRRAESMSLDFLGLQGAVCSPAKPASDPTAEPSQSSDDPLLKGKQKSTKAREGSSSTSDSLRVLIVEVS